VTLTLDNDFFFGGDRHYTNGLQVAALVDRQSFPGWLNAAPPLRWSVDPEIMVAVGQRIYTPTDKSAVHPDSRDRPYAGWLYLLADVRTRFDTAIDHVSFSIGMIGPASLARQTQTNVHHLLHMDPPEHLEGQSRRGSQAVRIPRAARNRRGMAPWARFGQLTVSFPY
jgi:hypothetical protein